MTCGGPAGKRAPSSAALSSVYSQDSLEGAGSSSSTSDLTNLGPQQQQQQPGPSPLSRTSGASDPDNSSSGAAAAAKPPVPPSSPQQQGGVKQQPAAATAAANNSTSNASPSSGQATAISLHWLSRPRSVLVMRKMAPSTEPVFAKTLEWLRWVRDLGILACCSKPIHADTCYFTTCRRWSFPYRRHPDVYGSCCGCLFEVCMPVANPQCSKLHQPTHLSMCS